MSKQQYQSNKGKYLEKSMQKKETHIHNRFTARLEYVRVHPGEKVPEK